MTKTCSIKQCRKLVFGRGWCGAHYAKWRKYGNPTAVKQVQLHGLTLLERFHANVPIFSGQGCWEWKGYRDPNGYGRLNIAGYPELAHRISWQLFRHEIGPEHHVLHKCDNPPCVRPEHLFLGDQAANNADKMAKKRHRYGVSRGAAHGMSKVTEKQVREIRAHKGPARIMAEKFGISITQALDIRNRRVWKHLP